MDFSGDVKHDYVLYNSRTLQTAVWYMTNNRVLEGGLGPPLPTQWHVVGVADFDRDGHADYLLFNSTRHQSAIWYMSGRALRPPRPDHPNKVYGPPIDSGYELKGTADYNRDLYPDYVLFSPRMRETKIWYMNDNRRVGIALTAPNIDSGWRLALP